MFKEVYPSSSIIPKMHYMCHYPELILQVGPLVRSWTMRHEAKFHFFKQATHIGNFKNVTFILAQHQQKWICYQQASSSVVDRVTEFDPGPSPGVLNDESESRQEIISALVSDVDKETTVFKPNWVRMDGILYKPKDCYIVVAVNDRIPDFASVDEIYALGSSTVLFIVTSCSSLYDSHHCAYYITHLHIQVAFPYVSGSAKRALFIIFVYLRFLVSIERPVRG